jgi:hypothetical protein
VGWDVGFSGVLHGLCVIVVIRMVLTKHDAFALIALVILMGKLVWEHYHGALTQAALEAPVIVSAHSYGALAGFVYALAESWVARRYWTDSQVHQA